MAIEADISGWKGSSVSQARRGILERAVVDAYHMAVGVHMDMEVVWDQDAPRRKDKRRRAWLDNDRLVRYFGSDELNGSQIKQTHRRVRKLHDQLFDSKHRWIVKPNQSDCNSSTTNAHVLRAGQGRRVFICPAWFQRPAMHRPGILIHEMVHKLGLFGRPHHGVKGPQNLQDVLRLARNDPEKARKNPDTYEFLYQHYYHRVDAAVWRRDNNKVYLFSGNRYTRFSPDLGAGADDDYPKPIQGNWHGLPNDFERSIDAAVWRDDKKALYFFKNRQYVRFSNGSTRVDPDYPKPISNWPSFPFDRVDAAVWRGDVGKLYFFRQGQYVRYSDPTKPFDNGYPKPIQGNWKDLPNDFERDLGAALWHWDTSRLYFLHGDQYVRYSDVPNVVDAGYPRGVLANWKGVPSFSPSFLPSRANRGAFKVPSH